MNNFLPLHSSYVYTFTRTSKNNSRKYILILETKYLENIWEWGGAKNKQTNEQNDTSKRAYDGNARGWSIIP